MFEARMKGTSAPRIWRGGTVEAALRLGATALIRTAREQHPDLWARCWRSSLTTRIWSTTGSKSTPNDWPRSAGVNAGPSAIAIAGPRVDAVHDLSVPTPYRSPVFGRKSIPISVSPAGRPVDRLDELARCEVPGVERESWFWSGRGDEHPIGTLLRPLAIVVRLVRGLGGHRGQGEHRRQGGARAQQPSTAHGASSWGKNVNGRLFGRPSADGSLPGAPRRARAQSTRAGTRRPRRPRRRPSAPSGACPRSPSSSTASA